MVSEYIIFFLLHYIIFPLISEISSSMNNNIYLRDENECKKKILQFMFKVLDINKTTLKNIAFREDF